MKIKRTMNLRSESVQGQNTDVCCEGLMCPENGTQYIEVKAGNGIINIWLCKKCSEKMRS